jgi:hypothetical protein
VERIIEACNRLNVATTWSGRTRKIATHDDRTIAVGVARYVLKPKKNDGTPGWRVETQRRGRQVDLKIVARLEYDNRAVRDYFCLPGELVRVTKMRFWEDNPKLESFRYDSFDKMIDGGIAPLIKRDGRAIGD